jgi:hypothetical protein
MTGRAGIPEPGRLGPVFLGGAAALGGPEATAAEADAEAIEAEDPAADLEPMAAEGEASPVDAEAPPFEAQPQAPDPHPPALFAATGVFGARARSAEALGSVVLGSAAAIGAA